MVHQALILTYTSTDNSFTIFLFSSLIGVCDDTFKIKEPRAKYHRYSLTQSPLSRISNLTLYIYYLQHHNLTYPNQSGIPAVVIVYVIKYSNSNTYNNFATADRAIIFHGATFAVILLFYCAIPLKVDKSFGRNHSSVPYNHIC